MLAAVVAHTNCQSYRSFVPNLLVQGSAFRRDFKLYLDSRKLITFSRTDLLPI